MGYPHGVYMNWPAGFKMYSVSYMYMYIVKHGYEAV